MNLMKYFNFNFLKENIKKSKGLIILAIIVLPLLNVFSVLLFLKSGYRLNLATFGTLSLVTGIGAFVVPIMLAYIFFGFVFKKKSVDFYLSKPISRKGIFITNTIGGTLLITAFILINSLLYIILGLFTSLVVPFALVIDYFVYWWVTYLFMFVISVLAISLSGNVFTSFVALGVILCTYPITSGILSIYPEYANFYYKCSQEVCDFADEYNCFSSETCEIHKENNEYQLNLYKNNNDIFTTPLNALIYKKYDTKSVVKTSILIIIYICISYYIFQKRKMEDNECGIKNPYLHYTLKTLVFLPICFLIYAIISESSVGVSLLFCLCLVGAMAFYILYDVITRREIYKFKLSIFIFILSFAIFQGLFFSIEAYYKHKEIVFDNIESIFFSDLFYDRSEDIVIKDENLINDIIKLTLRRNYNGYNYTARSTKISLGKDIYNLTVGLNDELLDIIKEYADKMEIENDYQLFDYDHMHFAHTPLGAYIPVTKELKEYTKKVKDNKITLGGNPDSIELYNYKNHEYDMITIPINSSQELYSYVGHIINQQCFDEMQNKKSLQRISYISDYTAELKFRNESQKIVNLINMNYNEFAKFLENHKNDEVSDEYIMIWYDNKDIRSYYFIWDIKSFEEWLLKYQNN